MPYKKPRVLIQNHHEGYIDWTTYEANRARIAGNTRPRPHATGSGPVREGGALLQGLAICGNCGRKLRTHYTGRTASPGYHCPGRNVAEGRGRYCLNVGAMQIDEAIVRSLLAALTPLGVEAALAAAERLEADRDGALAQWRHAVERATYEERRAERRYMAVDPDNRLVARGLEAEWEKSLRDLETAKAELTRREQQQPRMLGPDERVRLLALGADLHAAWEAPTTSPRDKKELLRTALEEVIVSIQSQERRAHLTLRWRGGALTETTLDLPRLRPAIVRTNEDTIALVRRLSTYYPDTVIAGILNRQGRTSAYGHRFDANTVGNLRRHWKIPCFRPSPEPAKGELMTIRKAAAILGVAPSTIHRALNDGAIAGEQLTVGAPWRIRLTNELRARFSDEAPPDYFTMYQTMRRLGVSRQTVWQRVKRGELEALYVTRGRQKGLRIKLIQTQSELFGYPS